MPRVSLPGYDVGALLRRTATSATYEAVRRRDQLKVVAKLYTQVEGESARAHFEHEYRLLSALAVEGAVKALDLVRSEDRQVLVLEHFAGVELGQFMAEQRRSLEIFLSLATRIARILAGVHAQRIIHRDIKPSSILVAPRTLQACLVDFSISIALKRNHRRIYDPGMLQGTLPYISPEQTGRMARGVDQRSDLYALGVTFYELLAGRRPFEADEPLALVHAHLARQPRPLRKIRPQIPDVLARIVERLLAKDPADRYQSARSLLGDLERCEAGLIRGDIEPFVIAASDLPDTPQLPSRLYGREAELRQLFAAFKRARGGRVEMLLIHGAPGIGKTALVGALQRELAGLGGYFASGKFELQRRDVPILALRQALAALAELLLLEDDKRLARWRQRCLDALGSLCGVLLELVPKLERLLGPQPKPAALGALESRNRLLLAVKRFLGSIASCEHPLVLFLDDLQWGDAASLQLLEGLVVEQEAQGLLLIGAYRDAEAEAAAEGVVSLDDDLALPAQRERLERLATKRRPAESLRLGPLPLAAVAALIGDTLRVETDRARGLARSLAGRTENNPFLIRQLLLFLADEGLLERQTGGWSWDEVAVRRAGIPEDTAGMMLGKVTRLPQTLQQMLIAASCIGSRFDLLSLAATLAAEPVELLPHLEILCDEGLLIESGDAGYRFSHDRIEAAAARGLEPQLARKYHESVGRFLLRTTAEADLADRVFEIVDHLNWCLVPPVADPELFLHLARLDQLAGAKAIGSAAYPTAERFLAAGIEALERTLPEGGETAEPSSLSLSLHIDLARSIALGGRHEEAARLFDQLLDRQRDPVQVGRVCAARVEVLTIRGDYEEASRWGLRGLVSCGLRIPRHASKARLATWLLRLKLAFRHNARDRLLALPECTDPQALVRAELLARLVIPSYLLGDSLFPALAAHHALHMLRHGRSATAYYPLTSAGTMLSSLLGDYAAAEQVALAAMELSRGSNTSCCRTTMGACHSVLPWVQPYRECLAELEAAFESGREEGDVEFAGLVIVACTTFHAVIGHSLEVVIRAAERAARYRAVAGMTRYANRQQGLLTMCEVLSGRRAVEPDEPTSLEGLNLESDLPGDDSPSWCSEILWRMQLLMFLNCPERAFALGERIVKQAERAFFTTHYLAEYVFFHGLAAACQRAPDRRRRWQVLRRAHRRQRQWARLCEANFAHKALALAAEMARLRGRHDEAFRLYEQAAQSAEEHGFAHLQALFLERLGRFARATGLPTIAEGALRKSRDLYATWGAMRKVAWLAAELPELRDGEPGGQEERDLESSSTENVDLDLASVLKTSQAISEEIRLGGVVDRVMAAAIENAGAQRGALMLEHGGELVMAAEGAVGIETIRHDLELPLERCADRLALSVLRLAARTEESVMVADAVVDKRCAVDPYVIAHRVRSIACVPILKQGRCSGVLYLENNLAPGAFTAERADVLRVLSAQAAISLENARLYEEQSKQVKVLSGLLPICAGCKKIRDDEGYWAELELYIDAHSEATFSHGICPACMAELYPDV